MRAPEIWMIRDWCILRVETLGCGIKQMKAEICDARDHFSGRTAPGKGFADTEQTSGARNRRKHGVSIERFDCAQVDNFDIESVTREFLRRSQGFLCHRAVAHDREIAPLARNART